MAVKLSTSAEDFDTASPDVRTMLANLQANILKPHGRNFTRHVFLRFLASEPDVKAWIRTHVEPSITRAAAEFNRPSDESDDGGLISGFFLTASGYEYLGYSTKGFESGSFRNGMKEKNDGLFSKLLDANDKDPDPAEWDETFRGEMHALVAFADDKKAVAQQATERLLATVGSTVCVLGVEEGNVLRRGKEPVEHFGYFDGISQPVFTRRDLANASERNPDIDAWNPAARLSLVLVDDPLSDAPDAFGSYLVYRKLAQDVERFNQRVRALATDLGMEADLAGALVVGRFKNGTPVLESDHPGTSDFTKKNDFNFRNDRAGAGCPFHAHIRKSNPRGTTPLTTFESERGRRIARRGIPYGPPMPGVADDTDDVKANSDPRADRGLLFLCFQANIEDQFEFIQRTWVDNDNFPSSVLTLGLLQTPTGDDPVIGQSPNKEQQWPLKWNDPEGGKRAVNFESAVTLKGGEYFFAPSIPFIRSL
jgi:Dyp-type peroxidase family